MLLLARRNWNIKLEQLVDFDSYFQIESFKWRKQKQRSFEMCLTLNHHEGIANDLQKSMKFHIGVVEGRESNGVLRQECIPKVNEKVRRRSRGKSVRDNRFVLFSQ